MFRNWLLRTIQPTPPWTSTPFVYASFAVPVYSISEYSIVPR
jgi:hypothetical protein